jgi:sRNA-binding carbon storage regulator CsrA
MLAPYSLLRRKHQSVLINDEIIVTVADLQVDAARLVIGLPRGASMVPLETYDAIKAHASRKGVEMEASVKEMPSLEALNRLASKLTSEQKRYISREMVFEAILEAVAALEEQLSGATSLEHLQQLLLRRRY